MAALAQNQDETRHEFPGGEVWLGDNLPLLRQIESESVRLIYIDPPFNTGRRQSRKRIKAVCTNGDDGDRIGFGGKHYKTQVIGESGYDDSFADYLGFLRPRLEEAHRILAADGSLFFHIDWREAARCRLLLEEIFGGTHHCINEIIWAYDYGARSKSRWPTKHDNIYWFAKNPDDYIFNYDDIDHIPYMAPSLVGEEKAARGKTPTDVWWQTIVPTNGKEKTGYSTQKPEAIIQRIIKTHSNIGDTVLDFFAGSGTVGAVAQKTNRKFTLIDSNEEAYAVMYNRLENTTTDNREKEDEEKNNLFAKIVSELLNNYKNSEQQWDSQYEHLQTLPPATKGKIARKAVIEILRQCWNLKSEQKNNLLLVERKKIAVKFSLIWKQGKYTFEQIRNDKDYDYLFLLGISPFKAHAWIVPKDEVRKISEPQHSQESRWLKINPNNINQWPKYLRKYDGTLENLPVNRFLMPDKKTTKKKK